MCIKGLVLNNLMIMVKNYNPGFDQDKLDEVRYGLEGIYLSLTKIVVITIIACLLGIFKEYITVLLLFNLLRFTGFGIHATKSWMCWISSTITFIGMPLLCKFITIPNYISYIIAFSCLLCFLIHAPSDTPKRPLVKNKKRLFYKVSTVSICLIYIYCAFKTNTQFVHNAILASMIIESVLIHPLTYKIFRIPYNNYKRYKSIGN